LYHKKREIERRKIEIEIEIEIEKYGGVGVWGCGSRVYQITSH
jgi:hypothetical protein